MARQISFDVSAGVNELITHISGFREGSEPFLNQQKHLFDQLKKSDTMYFLNKREVDQSIAGMAEKFNFHGFMAQAKALQEAYDEYVKDDLPKSASLNRLNIVKLLLCLSERPTSKFLEDPDQFEVIQEEDEEDINWGEYLKEGIEEWKPNFDESTDCSSNSSVTDGVNDVTDALDKNSTQGVLIHSSESDVIMNLRANREELLNTIQHTWYNQSRFHDTPFSERREANIGIIWENHLEKQAMGLIMVPKSSVFSEYKVIREILWQLWHPHTSAVFELDGNNIKARNDITISSTRSMTLESFLNNEFIPHIELLEFFRDFSKTLDVHSDDFIVMVPQTYRSYSNALQNIISPIYISLSELEDKIREQETTYTLLNLSKDLRMILNPLYLLRKIQNQVVIDFRTHSNLTSTVTLLVRLHSSLQFAESKLDQDLRVSLYIESLYHYLTLIDSWLIKNDLMDYTSEFVIDNKNKTIMPSEDETDCSICDGDICQLNFELREEIDNTFKEDGVIAIIRETVLQIGRNLHLLRLLGKLSLLQDQKETIYEEFVRKTLTELRLFFGVDVNDLIIDGNESDIDMENVKYKCPVVCTEECKTTTEMDKLENLVDTTDGFLMLAFEDYFIEKPIKQEKTKLSLFEKISKITTTFFPVSNFFENILSGILKEKFTVSGLMVKNMFIEQYLLEKQFQFLRHIFLFYDNMIFPFYRRLFEKIDSSDKNWANDIWLTSHLHDIVSDAYPEFHDRCTVQVGETWRTCADSLAACDVIDLQYEIQWPSNIVISGPQMALYRDVFHFVLRIKWGLYTLNRLSFTDLEPKKKPYHKTKPTTHKTTVMKLKFLKFALINLLNSIQHYIFAFVFMICLQKFELDFEKANDLSSIMESHFKFINNIHAMTMEVRKCGKKEPAFENVMHSIKILKNMWKNIENATPDRLQEYYEMYETSYRTINPIICPVYLYDY
ncbi:unnamed protein product [Phaedon cochleariae]|uniref:Gamma-tubulin complex component n=1 Tax=Phaedon cochleariae TaxID=80249 RepID=A0A9P0DHF5_PHACE|nr:unnamed protein product [Phaedon cochleariae]